MKRVVITGIGIVSPIGVGKEEFWKNLCNGLSGITELTCIDTSCFRKHRGGEIKNLDPSPFLQKDEIASLGRGSLMGIMAAKMALKDAKISLDKMKYNKIGVSIGTTMGEVQALENISKISVSNSESEIPADLFKKYSAVSIAGNIARVLKCNSRVVIIPNACAAGNFAISYAFELLKDGIVDLMFSGGVDPFSMVAFTGFNRLGAMSHDVISPFDRDSNGMMVSEGAGVIIMESVESALKRNARVYAEVVGYGLTCDAKHMTAPHPDGITRAMEQALLKANISTEEVDAVIAHGTGTPANDRAEINALNKVFYNRQEEVPVTSIKSMIGHTMGAASSIEAITNALMVSRDVIPPTINFRNAIPEINPKIQIVANQRMTKKLKYGMNNALAFGGSNSSLILKKFQEM